jgi:acyl CoA:acetate/3-ketoacid CoA transferase beta subunit
VITDLCVLDVTPSGFEGFELAPGVTRGEVERRTEASVRFSETSG